MQPRTTNANPSKRTQVSALLSAPLLCATLLWPAHATAEPRPYNVVLITADAMRADMLGANGNTEVKTPRLDAVAAEGTNFSRAYASLTTTTPSHASLLSSLYAKDHKAYDNMSRISDEIVTLPEILKEQGWHTAGIVNLRWLNAEVSNIPQGITEFAKCNRTRKADRTNRWVLSFLDRRKGEKAPFFLWIHYIDTHTPYHAPGAFERQYYPKGRDPRSKKHRSMAKVWKAFPKHLRDNEDAKRWLGDITDADYVVGTYKGSVSYLDAKVGEVVDRLRQNGQWDKTLFVFTADHGEALGEHGIWFDHAGLFEVTTRVPLIVRAPGQKGGAKSDAVVGHVDVMPTVLAQLGLPAAPKARGEDLAAVVAKPEQERVALLEHAGNNLVGVVTQRYKYVRHQKNKWIFPAYRMRKGSEELYDLEADPDELRNLAKDKPEVLKEMRALLDKQLAQKAGYKGQGADVDQQTLEQLRSLGYIQ